MQTLSPEEIYIAQRVIDDRESGLYELSELYGSLWSSVCSPTSFGAKFRRAVESGQLKRITWNGTKTNNHQVYKVFGK